GGTIVGQKMTGKNGTAIWTGLTAGAYILEEVDPADGYSIVQSSEPVYFADSGEQSVITGRFENTFSALPPVLLSAIRATVKASEDRICRLLFKLAVEQDMTMNILAAGMERTEEDLRELRPRCVREVKET